MLGLTLRDEFKGRRLKGTAIELTNKNNTGATQVAAQDFLRITYPSHDVLKTIAAAGPGQGRPVTLKGQRGQGKSHLMAALYHALTDHAATRHWLNDWSHTLGDAKIGQIPLRSGIHVITESLHRQRYKFLWDLLFDNHPHGAYCRGKWEALGDKKPEVPSDEILLELFEHTPTALILPSPPRPRRAADLAQDPRGRYPDPQRRRGRREPLSCAGSRSAGEPRRRPGSAPSRRVTWSTRPPSVCGGCGPSAAARARAPTASPSPSTWRANAFRRSKSGIAMSYGRLRAIRFFSRRNGLN